MKNEAIQQLTIAVGALTIALLDKGILTQEEYDRAYAQATNIVDQESAKQRDETRAAAEAEMNRLFPGGIGGKLVRELFRDEQEGP